MERRPISSRSTRWAVTMATMLAHRRIMPNTISIASVVCAMAAALCFAAISLTEARLIQAILLVAGATSIQMRLLCNLFDGMVAVEGGFKTPSGEIFNDFPDRLSDPLILIGAGYCVGCSGLLPALGWAAAVMALLTAYTRVLGASSGAAHHFAGPMAKQHRMAVITGAALLSIIECASEFRGYVFATALSLVILGCIITVIRRLRLIVGELEHGV